MVVTQRRRLTTEDWIDAALAAIAEGGVPAVAVEPLAARLGATKGSFYWHFANRDALLDAALARWEARTTTEVIEEITGAADGPDVQLRALVIRVIGAAESDRVGPALLATPAHPAVAPVLARATRARLDVITTLLRRLGLPAAQARHRALLAYSAYLGHAQLAHSTPDELPTSKDARRAYLDHVLRVLTAR
ncbi:TetR/AcrR family transcriptional regulator [Luedemannella flava]|uniref:TetR/AcrR family transcriptional regulator n=1 Tax=Luedemannella flava TaxID=349316 RepID=A0ABP4YQD4_9ACTN